MRTLILLAAVVLCILMELPALGQTSPAPATPPASAAADPALEEINALRAGSVEAFNRKDIAGVLAYTHPDVIVTWQDAQVSRGHDAVRKYYERMMVGENRIVESIAATPVVDGRVIHGATTISYGRMNDVFKLRDGSEFHLDSRFTAVLANDEGKWIVRAIHFSGNVFDNQVQSAIVRKGVMWTAIAGVVGGLVVGLIIGKAMGRRRPAAG